MAGQRRDSKHRVLRRGESIRAKGKYQFKYHVDGNAKFVYSWRLDPTGKNMTIRELVDRYMATKTGVKKTTKAGYNSVKNFLAKEPFGGRKIFTVKTSDAKLFLIKLATGRRKKLLKYSYDSWSYKTCVSDGGG